MSDQRIAGSFRDPSGFLFESDGVLYRQINVSFKHDFDRLIDSGLYDALIGDGLLIPHMEADRLLAPARDAYKVIQPERVPFISYPYEWCFSQLKDAALATLRIQARAMDFGMSLRDASAFNIQFYEGRPVLIDTLSFGALVEGRPWVAYNQFCRHFLAPLALAHHRDARLTQLSRVHIDGIPLELASALLPRRSRYRPATGIHIHAHARSQARAESQTEEKDRGRSFTLRAFKGVLESLRGAVAKMTWEPPRSVWTEYYGSCDHYPDTAVVHKREIIGSYLDDLRPESVWDLGANTGAFSRLASGRGIPTVSLEMDAGCVEANYRAIREKNETTLLPLVMDLTNPSPSLGWASDERSSLAQRGPADLAMALALVHHLAIGNNVPLDRVARYLRSLCRRLVIEWVPKTDPKVQTLLSSREDVFADYTRDGFERAFLKYFSVERHDDIRDSERVLYLLKAI